MIFLRIPTTSSSYNKAKAVCRHSSGSLLRVEHIKLLDLNLIKTLSKDVVLRIDAKKGINKCYHDENDIVYIFSQCLLYSK